MSAPEIKPAKPFSAWELGLAWRYLRARRKEGGIALIAIISFLGIMLGVMVLVIVMSVMNGFTSERPRGESYGASGRATFAHRSSPPRV